MRNLKFDELTTCNTLKLSPIESYWLDCTSFKLAHRYAIFLCSLDAVDYPTRLRKISWATNYLGLDRDTV